jgi:hypothetical protein
MFNCEKCGKVGPGMSQIRIPSIIRNVNYVLQVKQEPRGFNVDPSREPILKTVGEKQGSEIVEEVVFCKNCVPADHKPVVLKDAKECKMIVKRKKKKKFKNYDKDEE